MSDWKSALLVIAEQVLEPEEQAKLGTLEQYESEVQSADQVTMISNEDSLLDTVIGAIQARASENCFYTIQTVLTQMKEDKDKFDTFVKSLLDRLYDKMGRAALRTIVKALAELADHELTQLFFARLATLVGFYPGSEGSWVQCSAEALQDMMKVIPVAKSDPYIERVCLAGTALLKTVRYRVLRQKEEFYVLRVGIGNKLSNLLGWALSMEVPTALLVEDYVTEHGYWDHLIHGLIAEAYQSGKDDESEDDDDSWSWLLDDDEDDNQLAQYDDVDHDDMLYNAGTDLDELSLLFYFPLCEDAEHYALGQVVQAFSGIVGSLRNPNHISESLFTLRAAL